MATDDFFRARLDQMIDLRHPLAVLAKRMPWAQIEAALAPALAHKNRSGNLSEGLDLFGPTLQPVGAGVSAAGRPRLPTFSSSAARSISSRARPAMPRRSAGFAAPSARLASRNCSRPPSTPLWPPRPCGPASSSG